MKILGLVVTLIISSCMTACSSDIDTQWLENKYTDESSKFVSLDGNRVHYRDEGKGETIVLIHGTASSLHTWDQWADLLKNDFRVVRMDLPGFGLTGPDHLERYEVKDDVIFIKGLLDKLNIKRAHFVGSSLGGRIAWQFTLDHSEKVQTLSLMNSLGYLQDKWPPPIEMAQWPIVDELMKRVSPRFMYEFGLKDVYHDKHLVDDELVDRYYELSRYPGNMDAFPTRVKARLDQDADLIRKISVPTLIQWGQEDKYFPVKNAFLFEQDIRNAQLRVYPDVGHLPMEEVSQESLSDYLEFISQQGNLSANRVSEEGLQPIMSPGHSSKRLNQEISSSANN